MEANVLHKMVNLVSLGLLVVMVSCGWSEATEHIPTIPRIIESLCHQQAFVNQLKNHGNAYLDLANTDPVDILQILNLQSGLLGSQANISLGVQYNVSQACIDDSVKILEGLITEKKNETWATSFLDAFGKLPSGVLQGAATWLGGYKECRDITPQPMRVNTTMSPRGQYCTANLFIEKLASPFGVTLGVCVPETCNYIDVWILTAELLARLKVNTVEVKYVSCKPQEPPPLDTAAISVIVILSVLGGLIVWSTLYDIIVHQPRLTAQDEPKAFDPRDLNGSEPVNEGQGSQTSLPTTLRASEYTPLLGNQNAPPAVRVEGTHNELSVSARLLLSFSVVTNAGKILTVDGAQSGQLGAVHGIRFLSMSWVILGHTLAFSIQYTKNPMVLFTDYLNRYTFQTIFNATVSVDSFFLLSGTLASYLLLRQMKRSSGPRHVNWALVYFHRFWRLTPPYMLVIAIYTTLFHYMGDGPTFPDIPDKLCQKYWWRDILYINNFFSSNETCIDWTWYLANDMQFFLISPLILVALYNWVVVGIILILALIVMNSVIVGVLTRHNDYPADLAGYNLTKLTTDPQLFTNYFDEVYVKPYCRVGPYAVGLLLGYILYKSQLKLKLRWYLVVIGWALAFLCNYSVLYGLNGIAEGTRTLSPGVNALYAALHRTVWGVGLAWVILACCTGHGGPVNKLLSWSVFVPLSRLTYMAYLCHPIVMSLFLSQQEQPFMYSDVNFVYMFFGHLVASYMVAFVLSVCLEAPMISLEKVIFPQKNRS